MTAVVAIMKVFGHKISNLPNPSSGKVLIKPNKWLNLKKKHIHISKKHHNRLSKPISNVSERLIVQRKTIRVLLDTGSSDLDTGSSGDLLFIRNGFDKYIPCVKMAVPQLWDTSKGNFQTEKVGEIKITFVEYSASKSVHLTPNIVS